MINPNLLAHTNDLDLDYAIEMAWSLQRNALPESNVEIVIRANQGVYELLEGVEPEDDDIVIEPREHDYYCYDYMDDGA